MWLYISQFWLYVTISQLQLSFSILWLYISQFQGLFSQSQLYNSQCDLMSQNVTSYLTLWLYISQFRVCFCQLWLYTVSHSVTLYPSISIFFLNILTLHLANKIVVHNCGFINHIVVLYFMCDFIYCNYDLTSRSCEFVSTNVTL